MRKMNWMLGAAALLCLLSGARGYAEEPPAPPAGGRGNFNPEEFRKRMMDRIKENLGASDDDWKALQPKIENVQKLAMTSRMGGGFGRRRGQGGGGGNAGAAPAPDANAAPKTDLDTKREALQTLADNKEADAKQVKDKMQEYREARDKSKAELKKAQDELRELLTPRQEAQLVLMGLLD
jgi:hypothetical protein